MSLHKTSFSLHSIEVKYWPLNGWLYLEHLAGDIDIPFNLGNVVEVHKDVVLKISIMYIVKLFCLIHGSLSQNISPLIALYPNLYTAMGDYSRPQKPSSVCCCGPVNSKKKYFFLVLFCVVFLFAFSRWPTGWFSISCSSYVFVKKKHARYYLVGNHTWCKLYAAV